VQRDEIVEAKEVHVRLPLEVARAELAALPEGRLKDGLRRAIEYAEFWNFRRGCEYVEAYEVDFHFSVFFSTLQRTYSRATTRRTGAVIARGRSAPLGSQNPREQSNRKIRSSSSSERRRSDGLERALRLES
jgi:hypothetical protein